MRPLISVIMPVFNAKSFLDEAILSIRRQSLRDFEFLIVDDGSVDASPEIIRRHRAEDPRISLHSLDHCGQVAAMKFAVSVSRGEYLARMDADDISMEGRLEAQFEYLSSHPEVALLGTQVEFIDGRGRLIKRSTYPSEPELVREELWRSNCICHSSVMLRRSAYEQAGGYRECFAPAEDYDLWLRVSQFAGLANLREYFLRYRINFRGQSFREPWQQALGIAVARQVMRSQTKFAIESDQPITYDRAKHIGLDQNELDSDIVQVYGSYFEFAASKGKHRLVRWMLRDLMKHVSSTKSASGSLLLQVANIYAAVGRRFLAVPYLMLGLSRQGKSPAEILRCLVNLALERKKGILLEISLREPPDELPVGGYIDEVLRDETGGELTIVGWSPFLDPSQERNKMIVYSPQAPLETRVSRHARPDVAKKYPACERVGFSCWLRFSRAIEDREALVTVLDIEGKQYRLVSATRENSSVLVEGLNGSPPHATL